jgi:hypothetical protein
MPRYQQLFEERRGKDGVTYSPERLVPTLPLHGVSEVSQDNQPEPEFIQEQFEEFKHDKARENWLQTLIGIQNSKSSVPASARINDQQNDERVRITNSTEFRMNTFVTVIALLVGLVSLFVSTMKNDGMKACSGVLVFPPVFVLWYYVNWFFLGSNIEYNNREIIKWGSFTLMIALFSLFVIDAYMQITTAWKITLSFVLLVVFVLCVYLYFKTGPVSYLSKINSNIGEAETEFRTILNRTRSQAKEKVPSTSGFRQPGFDSARSDYSAQLTARVGDESDLDS